MESPTCPLALLQHPGCRWVIGTIDEFRRKSGHYPNIDEVEFGPDNFGYETRDDWYQLTVTERFDLYYVYDSRDPVWKRLGAVPEK